MKATYAEGEMVKVSSREEIQETLDPLGRLDGCVFMEEMWKCCGQRFRIMKVVRNYFDERGYKMYRIRPNLYLLENMICDGAVDSLSQRCDHSCYFLWHEKWLGRP